MARLTNAKRRSASASRKPDAKGARLSSAEAARRSNSSASMALTTTTTAGNGHYNSSGSSSPLGLATHATTTTPLFHSLQGFKAAKPSASDILTIPTRKRARASTMSRSARGSDSNGRSSASHTRSPSANAITEELGGTTSGARFRNSTTLRSRLSAGRNSSPHHRLQDSTTQIADGTEGDEIFFEASSPTTGTNTAAATPLRHLQATPTSQLLSQLQDLPYTAQSDEQAGDEPEATVLFTPATVARRRILPAVAGESNERHPSVGAAVESLRQSTTTSSPLSGSRSSMHDEAVHAILRANPPTTTRPVELKPGYRIPSPRSPLWAALDASDETTEGRPTRGSTSTADESRWSSTQVGLFQEEEEEGGADVARHPIARLTATQEHRRFSTRHTVQDSISLPAPGHSLNLLDDEGLHDDEQPSFFVGERGTPSRQGGDAAQEESFVFSLTQEACKQEREQDHQAVLPRSRTHRTTGAAAATTNAFTTPSPARRSTRRRLRASQQASPFSQLQRDVEMASTATAAGTAAGRSPSSPLSAAANPSTMLSQRELRRRADMLKWAERTRAFFHFIDSLPLRVSNSPLKPVSPLTAQQSRAQRQSSSLSRRSRSQATSTARGTTGRSEGTVAASISLVRRSHSAVASAPASRHGSAAFEAVVLRVKQEAAAASKPQSQRRRSATAAARPSTS
ncbi:hypothetical protein ABL78_7152 [Leptomonas seymouri]|uniref:Uncharacterized protein n=1 Tax=Leptomonas seymouri TaxID=5684 RepID=A0A0N1PCI7_LEPSE|nr:hypothetical protein ABL78_7152 [Leptomonas seymouri]|eukprot:KPI83804.1 hypothetical protein ABL78_7152 [Leptomonas seymouri]